MSNFIVGLFHFLPFPDCPKAPQWVSDKALKQRYLPETACPSPVPINSSSGWGWETLLPVPRRMLFTAHQHTVLRTICLTPLWQLVFSNPNRCLLSYLEKWNCIFLLKILKIMQISHFFPADKVKRSFCVASFKGSAKKTELDLIERNLITQVCCHNDLVIQLCLIHDWSSISICHSRLLEGTYWIILLNFFFCFIHIP